MNHEDIIISILFAIDTILFFFVLEFAIVPVAIMGCAMAAFVMTVLILLDNGGDGPWKT